MTYDLYPAVDENLQFAPVVRAANALTPEFRSQVVPMTQTQRNNLSGTSLWDSRMVFNTTTRRIDVYDGTTSSWGTLLAEPPGIVKEYAGDTAPPFHVLADGSTYSRTGIYAALFAVCGTKFNIGGESGSLFRVPNRKGKTGVGYDASQTEFNAVGKTGGEKTHALSTGEMPAHAHGGATNTQSANHQHSGTTDGVGDHQHVTNLADAAYANSGGSTTQSYSLGAGATNGGGAHAHTFGTSSENANHAHAISAEGGGGGHNNLQPYIALNYIITL